MEGGDFNVADAQASDGASDGEKSEEEMSDE